MDLGSGGSWLATRRPSARRVISKGWLTPPTWRKCICEQPPRPAIPNMRAPLNAQDPVRRMAAVLVTPAVRAGLGLVGQTLRSLAALGAGQGVVLAADAPDLPLLLIGKLLRALGGAPR